MKCSTCGYQNSPARQQCIKCGATLLPAAKTSPAAPVPDWRKEITRKARAYGERKKLLTTPPHPLKENAVQDQVEDQAEMPPRPVLISSPEPFEEPVHQEQSPVVEQNLRSAPIDIVKQDLAGIDLFEAETEPETSSTTSAFFMRRLAALCIDHAILIVLQIVLAAIIARIVDMDVVSLAQSSWKVYVSVFAAWHFLYYLYFYRTSRQTPGQVFLGVELRDPASSEIPFSKILVRWIVMIVFNVFNAIPLFFHRNWLLLDRISGTEIRSMK
jgi:uncharacterized RDD family membrane protein YckC